MATTARANMHENEARRRPLFVAIVVLVQRVVYRCFAGSRSGEGGGSTGTFPPQHICPQTTREPARYFWTTVDKCIRDVKAIEKTAQTQYEGSGIVRQIGCRSCRVQAIWMGPRELEWRRRIYSHSISNAYIHVETV